MTSTTAKKIGSTQGLISVGIGILIVQLFIFWMTSEEGFTKGFFGVTTLDYKFNIFIGIIIMLLSGHFYGQIAGNQIIIKKRNYILIGFLTGMAVLITTGFLCGWTDYF